MYIFDFVRERRKELALTQKDLSIKANCSLSVVRRFEDNQPYNPNGRTFIKMANALDVNPEYLLIDIEWPE